MGDNTLPAFTATAVATEWQFAPSVTALLAVAAALYLWGAYRVGRRHPARPWSRWYAASFLAGLAVIVIATESGIGAYDDVLFWDHMIQHLLLITVAPPLLVAGRPMLLLLHASRNPLHTWAKRAMRSRVATFLTWPAFGVAAYAATITATHLTGFMNVVLTNDAVHEFEHALYVVVGFLYFLPLVGREPIRWRISYPVRMVVLFLAMPIDAFTGVALMYDTHNPFPPLAALAKTWRYAPPALSDVHTGGAVMWAGGSGIMVVLIMTTFLAWSRDQSPASTLGWFEEVRRTVLEDVTGTGSAPEPTAGADTAPGAVAAPGPAGAPPAAVDPAAHLPRAGHPQAGQPRPRRSDIDSDDDQLAAYNAYLARLNRTEHQSRR